MTNRYVVEPYLGRIYAKWLRVSFQRLTKRRAYGVRERCCDPVHDLFWSGY